ncbi:MAG: hypothetical protein ACTSW1_11090 [Candidatus Hodarchaeales archaeon]
MKVFRYVVPLSIFVLLIANVFSSVSVQNYLNSDYSKTRDQLFGASFQNEMSSFSPTFKVGSTITSGLTTLSINKDSYAPGDWVEVTAESNTDEMNGSLEWQLESPINEIAFDFRSDYQNVFSDPLFNDVLVPDWNNLNFNNIDADDGYLTLTENADPDKDDAEVFFNGTALSQDSRYYLSFDYMSKGENLLINPGFETGDTTGWDVNASYVTVVTDVSNASEGNSYAAINGTEGFLVSQNVSITGGRVVTFSVKATGVTEENFWTLRLEAYNSTGHLITFTGASDSTSLEQDEKGYAFNQIVRWTTPVNTSYIRAIFWGRDTGPNADSLYTGWLDECYLAEVTPKLIVSYWGSNNEWTNHTVDNVGDHQWNSIQLEINTGTESIPTEKVIRFILPDTNSYGNNQTSYWFIDNIKLNKATLPEKTTTISTIKNTGVIYSTWFHEGYNETLSSTYNIKSEDPPSTTEGGESKATIKIKLPTHQVYFGSWIFIFIIHRVDSLGQPLESDVTKYVNISFVIEEPMNYVRQDLYILRGSTNKTISENISVYKEYFEKETEVQAVSPGDNVTVLGYLEANSTNGEWYSLDYLEITSAYVTYLWNSEWTSKENITWQVFGFIPYNREGSSILDGNFSEPLANVNTMALNFKIPNRGIYGNISANLTITLASHNQKPDNVGGQPIEITIPIDLPEVRFKTLIINENLPNKEYYYLTDYFGGNVTIQFLNFNDTLETNYPNRNITSNITIPISDLDLIIYFASVNGSSETIAQSFHYRNIGNTILWLDRVDPHIVPGQYNFSIRWVTPYKLGVNADATLNTSTLQVDIRGTLEVLSSGDEQIKQGQYKTINFSIILKETNKSIGGLVLVGMLSNNLSAGKLTVYEEKGVYKIDLAIDKDVAPGDYKIDIFIAGRDSTIGSIDFTVIEQIDTRVTSVSPLNFLINIAGFAFIIGTSVIALFVMFKKNQSL